MQQAPDKYCVARHCEVAFKQGREACHLFAHRACVIEAVAVGSMA